MSGLDRKDFMLAVAASAALSAALTYLTFHILDKNLRRNESKRDSSLPRKSTFLPKGSVEIYSRDGSTKEDNVKVLSTAEEVSKTIDTIVPLSSSPRMASSIAAHLSPSKPNRDPSRRLSKKFSMKDITGGLRGKHLENTSVSDIYLHEVRTLCEDFPSADVPNVRHSGNGGFRPNTYNKIMGEEDFIISDIVRKHHGSGSSDAFLRAGPRSTLHFDPNAVRAAIVTCGGLCPGLNNVIRELVRALYYLYDVEHVMGIRGGYNGFLGAPGYDPITLTPDSVQDCHHQGGTILASSRGGFELDTIIAFLVKHGINQLYVIGGDGTHRGANALAEECFKRKLNIAVVGVPKTIDNDVDLIDRSFGFTTSVEAAQAAIISAKTEARCNMPNGIGIVKLMGRSAGFIAVHATLASGDVDLCLVPEVEIVLEGESGCLPHLMRRVKEQGHAVVVVAEGAGEELLGKSTETDTGGNRKLPPIGEFMKAQIKDYFEKHGEKATIKYLDPSYMIRSVPANASDSLYCMLLAHNAVHGAMAGYTAFSTGLVNNRVVYIPIPRLVATSPRVMDPVGRSWERVLSMTRQPQQQATFDADVCVVNDRCMV